MREYICIGPVPYDEDCVQVSNPNYAILALDECRRYVTLLREVFGPEPEGARLTVKMFEHDFGRSYEVVCYYDDAIPDSIEYSYAVERNCPARWTDTEKIPRRHSTTR